MTRYAKQYVLLWPSDCEPPHGLDLTYGSRDYIKVKRLQAAFEVGGFDPKEPALIGYPLNGKVKLLTGTHRHEAARRAGIMLPVSMRMRSDVEQAWGTPKWVELTSERSVEELELAPVQEHLERRGDAGLGDRLESVDWR